MYVGNLNNRNIGDTMYVMYIFQFGFNITNQPSVLKINIKLLHIQILLIKQLAYYIQYCLFYVPNKLFAHLDGHNALGRQEGIKCFKHCTQYS